MPAPGFETPLSFNELPEQPPLDAASMSDEPAAAEKQPLPDTPEAARPERTNVYEALPLNVEQAQPPTEPYGKADRKLTIKEIHALYDQYGQELFRYIRRLVGNADDAADLLHDTFVKAIKGKLAEHSRVRSWLFAIATNTAYDALRRRRAHPMIPLSLFLGEDNEGQQLLLADPQGLDEHIERFEASKRTDKALREIPKRYRQVLLLYYLGGLSYAEVARELGTVPSGMKTYLQRARDRFRERYNAQKPD